MALWNSTTDDKAPEREQARAQKRKLGYISNILVINDPKHPENNGKVFLYKYGKKIFDKIMDKARPTFEDQDPVNVFDYWEGANFKLRMKMVDRYPNYDASEFEAVSAVSEDDQEILEIANQQHKLSEFIDPANFKSYDELKRKLESVLSAGPSVTTAAKDTAEEDLPWKAASEKKSVEAPQARSKPAAKIQAMDEDDDDEMMSYFKSIAEE